MEQRASQNEKRIRAIEIMKGNAYMMTLMPEGGMRAKAVSDIADEKGAGALQRL